MPDRTAGIDMATLFEQVKNWGRWGDDDERGALNLITDEVVARAAALVTTGQRISLALDLPVKASIDHPVPPAQHMMLRAGDAIEVPGFPGIQMTDDYIGVSCHGSSISHLDALCHFFVGGQMYNGRPPTDVKSVGAMANAIDGAFDGLIGRGILLDIPRLRGVDWLPADELVLVEELEAAAAAAGLTITPGDVVLVSTGRDALEAQQGHHDAMHGLAGLDARCAGWIRDHDVGVLGSDAGSDPLPPNDGLWPLPIHQCCLVAMGVHLLDNLRLDEVAQVCAAEDRWEFLFTASPLRVRAATGSPLNPIAVF